MSVFTKLFTTVGSALPIVGGVVKQLSELKDIAHKWEGKSKEMEDTAKWVERQTRVLLACNESLKADAEGEGLSTDLKETLAAAIKALEPVTSIVKKVDEECSGGRFKQNGYGQKVGSMRSTWTTLA